MAPFINHASTLASSIVSGLRPGGNFMFYFFSPAACAAAGTRSTACFSSHVPCSQRKTIASLLKLPFVKPSDTISRVSIHQSAASTFRHNHSLTFKM